MRGILLRLLTVRRVLVRLRRVLLPTLLLLLSDLRFQAYLHEPISLEYVSCWLRVYLRLRVGCSWTQGPGFSLRLTDCVRCAFRFSVDYSILHTPSSTIIPSKLVPPSPSPPSHSLSFGALGVGDFSVTVVSVLPLPRAVENCFPSVSIYPNATLTFPSASGNFHV